MLDAALALLLEKVDAMTLAAMQVGDEGASFDTARASLHEMLSKPLPRATPADVADTELRESLGLAT